jgi:methyl-accepting chemotaxis protein
MDVKIQFRILLILALGAIFALPFYSGDKVFASVTSGCLFLAIGLFIEMKVISFLGYIKSNLQKISNGEDIELTKQNGVGEIAKYMQVVSSYLNAINKTQAVIEFNMDGTIITANKNFCNAMGYNLTEIQGKHHSMFVEKEYKNSVDYKKFWETLNKGEYQSDEYKRLGKNDKEIWILASYNPIIVDDVPVKVVKYATDITKDKLQNIDFIGQLQAINKSQAVIEFNMDGSIITANENFCNAVGYKLNEIKGKHHSLFADEQYKRSQEYKDFWAELNKGEYQAGEFKRIGKGGKEVYIQASYNPIYDLNGKPFKVVKYATNTTEAVKTRMENEAGAKEAVSVLQSLAQGDLTIDMKGKYDGVFSAIKEAINSTLSKLTHISGNIKESTGSLSSSANEISSASADLSQRTENQASTLEQTAASMEEITSTVENNSKNARDANIFAHDAKAIAQEGGDVVKKVVGAMEKITSSSAKIADIIGVIDEIAFQTNLLALNAAVEAARAGDAGKGFAVVASEVRALAGRSSQASKEIKELINESVCQVKDGSVLVEKAGTTLDKVVDSFNKLAGIISDISISSEEQTRGIAEINLAITQLDSATQENAAMVEETTASAQLLTQLAKNLNNLVGFFKSNKSGQRFGDKQNNEMMKIASDNAQTTKRKKVA